jgi:hypothetical protein
MWALVLTVLPLLGILPHSKVEKIAVLCNVVISNVQFPFLVTCLKFVPVSP